MAPDRPLTPQELDKIQAEADEIRARTRRQEETAAAEVAKNVAEARKFEAQAIQAEYEAASAEIELARTQHKREKELAQDEFHKVYRFHGVVKEDSVKACIATLSTWNRVAPKCPITLVINSPGGSIVDGFALWDFLTELRSEGHELTTIARGYAASMAGVLLQAGDKRIMGPTATLLIHEAQFGAFGSFGEVEDTMDFVKKLQDRILDIFAERSKLSKRQIKAKWRRKNWWMLPSEALKFGFVDEIGGGGVV